MSKAGWQGPINGHQIAENVAARLRIVSHPALRLGFLDAQSGRPFDHDDIVRRIQSETPESSLKRLGWDRGLFDDKTIEQAQYRYEEGRLLVIKYGLRCKSWNHPDFPPKALRDFATNRPDNERL
jgi:hypothetical protein